MSRTILLPLVAMIALAGCDGSADGDKIAPSPAASNEAASQSQAARNETAAATPVASMAPPPQAPAPPPMPVPPPPPPPQPVLTPEAEKGEKGARNVLLTWARALENHQFGTAWEQFGSPPASRAAYARWWQRYRTITVAIGDGSVEGGAGSLYYEVHATLTGTETSGRPFRLEGPVVVRRVNDVDGATPAQLRWHIASADLQTTH